MVTKTKIQEIIYNSIEEINQQRNLKIEKKADTPLFGFHSDLDSLGLVNLIVNVEENINDEYDASISIADNRAMSQKNSPFKSIETLSNYIIELLNEGK